MTWRGWTLTGLLGIAAVVAGVVLVRREFRYARRGWWE